MKRDLLELWSYKELLKALIQRNIKVRYKQSILGIAWAIFIPLLIVAVGILVRYAYSLASGRPLMMADVVGVAVKSVPWAFTVGAIRSGTTSLIGNGSLVTKIYFPKEVFPLSSVGSNLVDFAIASVPLAILVVIGSPHLGWNLLWIPVLFLILLSIIVGLCFAASAATLFFRDVKYIVEVMLTFGIFVTPVFFDVSMFGDLGIYLMLNPLSAPLDGLYSAIVLDESPRLAWLAYSALFGAAALIGGYRLFKRMEPVFAECI
jgi:ABC-type polysaccharide/polyol phosphate export permease